MADEPIDLGDDRYQIGERLGAGGMGVVYRAFDRERNTEVALKLLRKFSADAIYRFKQEFRALADVSHPNLVQLYELVSAGERWFFTMELLDGRDFLGHVRGGAPAGVEDAVEPTAQPASNDDTATLATARISRSVGPTTARPPFDAAAERRLRHGLRQLVAGLDALHRAGHLHCDVKPSNVIVTRDQRAVVLDFGVATRLAGGVGASDPDHLVGTPAYMAPEQIRGDPIGPASDWYGVGVMLYEALVGQRPFTGEVDDILEAKLAGPPVAPELRVPGLPDDLARLCGDLLALDPARRPTGVELLARLAGVEAEPDTTPTPSAPGGRPRPPPPPAAAGGLLVGRGHHLAVLEQAFERVVAGQPQVVLVGGASGVGKSTLVAAFLAGVQEQADVLVLDGRCYERETVPYKALDPLIDDLTRRLLDWPAERVAAVLHGDVRPLAQLFPVLNRLEAVVGAALDRPIPDAQEQRRRAFAAARRLLERLAARGPLVLHIDDVQWGDTDSALLLAEALRPPTPPLLLIASYRREEATASAFLKVLAPAVGEHVALEVEPLDAAESAVLASRLLGQLGASTGDAVAIARESGGNPFFVSEMARHLAAAGGSTPSISLDGVMRARIDELPSPARALLDMVAIAGRPLAQQVAIRAAGLDDDGAAAVTLLRNQHLVRTRGGRARDPIEPYHDRIRDAVVGTLPPDKLRAATARLAVSLEAWGEADRETLAALWDGAGNAERAAAHYLAAAEHAADALAFDRAARLYQRHIELDQATGAERGRAYRALADAHANAGRSAEAAAAYASAADELEVVQALRCRALAAENLLRGGLVDQGVDTLTAVVEDLGMRMPATRLRVLLGVLIGRFRLWLRGLRFRARRQLDVTLEQLTRLDITWAASTALGTCDPLRGALFQNRHMLESLAIGEPVNVTRALANEAIFIAVAGERKRARVEKVLARTAAVAGEAASPDADRWVVMGEAFCRYLLGEWQRAGELCEQAVAMIRERGRGMFWERNFFVVYSLWSLYYRGEIAEMTRRVPELLHEAESRGDLYMVTNLCNGAPGLSRLVRDDLDGARRMARESMAVWSQRDYLLQHADHLWLSVHADLYDGDGRTGLGRIERQWRDLRRAFLLGIEVTRSELFHLRARCALVAAAGAAGSERNALLRIADRDARRLAGERAPYIATWAALIRGGAAALRGDDRAVGHLDDAIARAEACDMVLFREVAHRCRGLVVGGEQGAAEVAAADAWMTGQSIADPARFAAMMAPGFGKR